MTPKDLNVACSPRPLPRRIAGSNLEQAGTQAAFSLPAGPAPA